MKCPKCGYGKNEEGVRVCNLCGEVLSSGRPAAPAENAEEHHPGETEIPEPAVSEAVKAARSAESAPAPAPAPAALPKPAAPGRPGIGFSHLRCSLLERPLRLDPSKAVTIGRAKENEIVIPSQMVSRRHGRVYFEKGLWVYDDLGSSNGSRVNGKRVDKVPLQSADVIDVGGFMITYKEIHDLSDVTEATMDDSKTMAIDANMLKRANIAGMDGMSLLGGLGGSLADIAIADILQLMEMQRKSGTLILDFEGAVGKIYIVNGSMTHAEYGKVKGEGAVYKMLSKAKGSFHFDPREPNVERTIDRATTSVLLDASREMDEGGR